MNKEFEYKVRANFKEALNNFNFVTVYRVMENLDWCWAEDNQSPTQEQMIDEVKDLFEHTINNLKEKEERWVESGGFLVKIYESGDVEIRFIAEEYRTYNEE